MDTRLPDGFTMRPATMDDAEVVAELVLATEWRTAFEPENAEQEIREDWRTLDLSTNSWLVFTPDGKLAAAADMQDHGHTRLDVFVAVHPDFQGMGLGTHLLFATDARSEELADLAPEGSTVKVYRPTIAPNEAATRILSSHGYSEVRRFYTMHTTLNEAEASNLPDGITVRTFKPGEDDRAFYEAQTEAFRDHWGDEVESFEEWKKHHLDRSDMDAALWFVAEDDAGEIAGVVISRARSADNGWVDILGVRRPWRGRGLGEALLRHAFREFRERGMTTASLGVDTESPTGATRLYERAGMEVESESVLFSKVIRSAETGS